jgi:hypothetical protein
MISENCQTVDRAVYFSNLRTLPALMTHAVGPAGQNGRAVVDFGTPRTSSENRGRTDAGELSRTSVQGSPRPR